MQRANIFLGGWLLAFSGYVIYEALDMPQSVPGSSLKQTLSMGDTGMMLLFTHPISLVLIAVAAGLTISSLYTRVKYPEKAGSALAEDCH